MRTGANPIRPATVLSLAVMILHVFNAANVRLGVPRSIWLVRSKPVGPDCQRAVRGGPAPYRRILQCTLRRAGWLVRLTRLSGEQAGMPRSSSAGIWFAAASEHEQ